MKHLTRILLFVSAAAFATSLTAVGSDIHYGILKPVSTIVFIVFFILHITQKEVALFDAENQQNIGKARSKRPAPVVRKPEPRGEKPVSALPNHAAAG